MTDGDSVTINTLCNSAKRDLRHPGRLPPRHIPRLLNLAMESLCYSANKGSDDAYDVSTSLTGPTRAELLLPCVLVDYIFQIHSLPLWNHRPRRSTQFLLEPSVEPLTPLQGA